MARVEGSGREQRRTRTGAGRWRLSPHAIDCQPMRAVLNDEPSRALPVGSGVMMF